MEKTTCTHLSVIVNYITRVLVCASDVANPMNRNELEEAK